MEGSIRCVYGRCSSVSGWSDVREEGVNWEGRGTRRGQSDEMEGHGSTAVVSLLGGSLSISRSFPVILWNDTLCRFRLFSSTWIGALYILINYFNEIFSVWIKAAVILKSSNICGTCLLNTVSKYLEVGLEYHVYIFHNPSHHWL